MQKDFCIFTHIVTMATVCEEGEGQLFHHLVNNCSVRAAANPRMKNIELYNTLKKQQAHTK